MTVGNPASFTGSIPEYYDRNLGPVIFDGYAADIARRVSALSPRRVLETAAGTGLVTRHLRDDLPADAELTATDLNAPMLERARMKFQASERISFLPADATDLPFPDNAFDAVVCQFGVMFFPDKAKSFQSVRRVLASKGRYIFSVWDAHRYNPFGRVVYDTVASLFPDDPPQFHKVPFGYHQVDVVKETLIDAGFWDIRVAVIRREQASVDPAAFARGLVFGTPLGDQIRGKSGVTPERAIDALADALRRDVGLPGIPLKMQAIIFDAG